MIPLHDRVCFAALCAHVQGVDREHPKCIGEQCSDYEICGSQIVGALHSMRELTRAPIPRRKKKKWGDG